MLEAEEEREEDGDFVVEAVERGDIVSVFAIQGPYVGRDEVDIILRKRVSMTVVSLRLGESYIVTDPSFPTCEVMLQVRPGILLRVTNTLILRRSILSRIIFLPEFFTAARSFHCQQKWPKENDAEVNDLLTNNLGPASLINIPQLLT